MDFVVDMVKMEQRTEEPSLMMVQGTAMALAIVIPVMDKVMTNTETASARVIAMVQLIALLDLGILGAQSVPQPAVAAPEFAFVLL